QGERNINRITVDLGKDREVEGRNELTRVIGGCAAGGHEVVSVSVYELIVLGKVVLPNVKATCCRKHDGIEAGVLEKIAMWVVQMAVLIDVLAVVVSQVLQKIFHGALFTDAHGVADFVNGRSEQVIA